MASSKPTGMRQPSGLKPPTATSTTAPPASGAQGQPASQIGKPTPVATTAQTPLMSRIPSSSSMKRGTSVTGSVSSVVDATKDSLSPSSRGINC
jgi:hypothetical protein